MQTNQEEFLPAVLKFSHQGLAAVGKGRVQRVNPPRAKAELHTGGAFLNLRGGGVSAGPFHQFYAPVVPEQKPHPNIPARFTTIQIGFGGNIAELVSGTAGCRDRLNQHLVGFIGSRNRVIGGAVII